MTDCEAATITATIAESKIRDEFVELVADIEDITYYLAETEYEYDYAIVRNYIDFWGWIPSTNRDWTSDSLEFRLRLVRP